MSVLLEIIILFFVQTLIFLVPITLLSIVAWISTRFLKLNEKRRAAVAVTLASSITWLYYANRSINLVETLFLCAAGVIAYMGLLRVVHMKKK